MSSISDIIGQYLSGGVKGKALAGATIGTLGAKKAAEEINVHPVAKAGLELAAGTAGLVYGGRKPSIEGATKKGRELAETAQKEGIKSAPGSILSATKKTPLTTRFLKYWGRAGEETRNQAEDFVNEMQQATENVLSEIHQPYKQEKNIEKLVDDARSLFKPARALAEQNPFQVSTTNFERVIDQGINELERSKVLSESSSASLKKLKEMKTNIPKGSFDLPAAIDTYQELNKILGRDILTKGDIKLKNSQKILKESILETGKNIPDFNSQFLGANQALHEAYSLKEASELLSRAFTDTGFDLDSFHKIVNDKKNLTPLLGVLGEQNLNRLQKLSELGKEAKKHFDAVEALLPESLSTINKEMGQLGHLTSVGGVAKAGSAFVMRGLAAKILTNPNFYNNYLGYVRSIRDNSPKMTAYFLRQLERDIHEERNEPKGKYIPD